MLEKLWGFLEKDIRLEASYRMHFALQFFGIFFSVMTFFFVGKLVPGEFVAEFGGDYFSFALVGVAFTSFLSLGMNSFSGVIRGMQLSGTLEAMLTAPTKITTILIGSSLWAYIFTCINVGIYFLIGIFIFGMKLNVELLPALLIFILTVVCFSSIGIISAGIILVLKKGNPFNFLVSNLFGLLGGMLYPITVMPEWLQALAAFLPITYSLKGMRLAVLQGVTLQTLLPDILILLLFSIVLFPVGIIIFSLALRKAKKEGSLIKY